MDNQQIKAIILEELGNIAPEIEASDVPDNEDLREALELDSMDFLNLVIAVSKRTHVAIPEADYQQVLTLNGMTRYVQNLLA